MFRELQLHPDSSIGGEAVNRGIIFDNARYDDDDGISDCDYGIRLSSP